MTYLKFHIKVVARPEARSPFYFKTLSTIFPEEDFQKPLQTFQHGIREENMLKKKSDEFQ